MQTEMADAESMSALGQKRTFLKSLANRKSALAVASPKFGLGF
jgi:hypothetical protein